MAEQAERVRVLRALHGEAGKRGLSHDDLHFMAGTRFGAGSVGALNLGQLKTLFREVAGRNLGRKRTTALPKRGYVKSGAEELVSAEDLETLGNAFSIAGWGEETRRAFVRRQLRGRDQIRTRADFHRVFAGVQAMNRRAGNGAADR